MTREEKIWQVTLHCMQSLVREEDSRTIGDAEKDLGIPKGTYDYRKHYPMWLAKQARAMAERFVDEYDRVDLPTIVRGNDGSDIVIPASVVRAAREIEYFFGQLNIQDWAFMGIQSRKTSGAAVSNTAEEPGPAPSRGVEAPDSGRGSQCGPAPECECKVPSPGCEAMSDGYYCNRPKGHSGEHVACTPVRHGVHRWGGKASAVELTPGCTCALGWESSYHSCQTHSRDTSGRGFVCSRPKGHSGPHIACGSKLVGTHNLFKWE